MNLVRFFRCVALAILHKGPRALAGLVPFGEQLWDIAEDVCKRLHEMPEAEVRAEVQAVAQADPAQVGQAVATAVAEVAGGQSPAVQRDLAAYLTQVPAAIRQSNKRPADPSGKTVAQDRSFKDPRQVLTLLPPRLPHFKPGDRPLPGVNWELVELLGVGGFGEVWKTHDPDFDGIPPVALKFCLDPQARDRLLRHEAAVLNQVMRLTPHAGIVPLRKPYLNADPPCLEYEYVGGGDLSVLVSDLRRLEPWHRCEHARWAMEHLAQAVAHAHAAGIVHRDLKPANILLQTGPGGQIAGLRVTDFGIGGLAAAQVIAATRTGTTRGDFLATALRGAHTPLYASPQQMRGDDPDPRDDVHALGVIWYQLLIGDLTIGASTDFALELTEQGVPGEMVALLGRCLSARAERRPATAAVLAQEIAALSAQARAERQRQQREEAERQRQGEEARRQDEARREAERLRQEREREESRRRQEQEAERQRREREREERRRQRAEALARILPRVGILLVCAVVGAIAFGLLGGLVGYLGWAWSLMGLVAGGGVLCFIRGARYDNKELFLGGPPGALFLMLLLFIVLQYPVLLLDPDRAWSYGLVMAVIGAVVGLIAGIVVCAKGEANDD